MRRPDTLIDAVHLGSRVYLQMPGDFYYSGILQRNNSQFINNVNINNEIEFFHVLTPHGSFTADLQPFPIVRRRSHNRVNEYRCFIPILGDRVLSTVLQPSPFAAYTPGTTRITMRVRGHYDNLFWGVMHFVGSGPRWIPRE